jgi:glycosyltransferase involved in cell wall biosynthesis
MDAADADAIHIATEGPLGWAARRYCLARGWPFSTGAHVSWATRLHRMLGVPRAFTVAAMRVFHRPSSKVLATSPALREKLSRAGVARVGDWSAGVDTRLFTPALRSPSCGVLGPLARPVSLYVGPVAHDRDVEDFLALDVPGSKVVCGDGPQAKALAARYPTVHWVGVLPRHELAAVYANADVLVYPGRHDGAGRVVLESMACGTPVAARPVDGPAQWLGREQGGCVAESLEEAWHKALRLSRRQVREHALAYGWAKAVNGFEAALALRPRTRRARVADLTPRHTAETTKHRPLVE